MPAQACLHQGQERVGTHGDSINAYFAGVAQTTVRHFPCAHHLCCCHLQARIERKFKYESRGFVLQPVVVDTSSVAFDWAQHLNMVIPPLCDGIRPQTSPAHLADKREVSIVSPAPCCLGTVFSHDAKTIYSCSLNDNGNNMNGAIIRNKSNDCCI